MTKLFTLPRHSAFGLAAIVISAFATPSYACDVGESYCNGGSLYVCQCWTTSGCGYDYSGVCEQNLAMNYSRAPHAEPSKFFRRHA